MNETTRLECLSADAAFGPIIDGCRNDFTFTFEQYFFSVIPSVLLLLLTPIRANTLWKRRSKVGGTGLRSIKLVVIGIFVALQFAAVILWSTLNPYGIHTPTTVASSLSFVSSLALFGLSYLEHSKSLRPSALLNGYLFFSVLFDAVVLRTLWLTLPNSAVCDVCTASFALKAVILFLEAKEKRVCFQNNAHTGPEETSGIYSHSLVWWLNSMIRAGYRHVLKPTDLFPVDKRMTSEVLNERFWTVWNKAFQSNMYIDAITSQPNLTKVLIRLLQWPLIAPIFPRIVLLAFTFCQPLLVQRLLEFLSDDKQHVNIGYALVGAYGVVYFGMSVSNSLYSHQHYRFISMIRGTLVSAIYTKTVGISITAIDDSAAVTLMSADVERLIMGLRGLHDLWANVVQFAFATWLLEVRLGWACVGPILVVLATLVITGLSANFANKFQLQWVAQIQKRVGTISSVLGHIKGIKMSGLSSRLTTLIQGLRMNEMKEAEKYWLVESITSGLAFIPMMLSPVATFAFYAIISAKEGSTLDAPKLFASLALLLLITQPLLGVLQDIVQLRSTFGCIERIEKFLVAETRSDHRLQMSNTSQPTASSVEELSDAWQMSRDDIELVGAAQGIPNPEEQNLSSDVVRIQSGSFAWSKGGSAVVRDVDVSIRRSQLTMLIGPVASGKSTLLKAILGESFTTEGFVYSSHHEAAYCEQTPWLINASVQNNIIGFSVLDQELYKTVIHCCDLEQDIATFPNGHDTLIGSKGISLSTGQKQRVAIARAVYARKPFVIFDDVFSGLDVHTQKKVFMRVLGPTGLLKKWDSTVLVATHAVNLLPYSDHIIALSSEGVIAEQGSFQDLTATDGYVRQFYSEHLDNHAITEGLSEAPSSAGKDTPSANVTPADASVDKLRQLGDWSVYNYYFKTIGWLTTTLFLFLALCWAFFQTFPTVWLKWFADSNARESNKRTGYYLGVYTVLQVSGLVAMFAFCIIAKRSGLRLHETILKTVMAAPMSFFSKTDTGSITNRFSQDMSLLDRQLPFSVLVVAATFLTVLGQIGLIASASYYIAASFPALFAMYYFVQKYYLRTSRQMRFLDLEEKAPVYTQFIESLEGLATIRAFSWEKASIAHNHALVDKSQKPFYLMFMIQTWLTLVLDLISTALAVIVVAISVKLRDTISVGYTGVSLTQIIAFTATLNLAIMFWTQMETSIGAVARVKQFEAQTENENQLGESSEPPADWPSQGLIEVNDLTVSYGIEQSRNALDGASMSIQPGEKLAIVGRTGSGKSTLLLALFRMIEITSGRIIIDGIDISTISRQTLRSRLNAIGEDMFFLSGSIRLNLDPHIQATDNQLRSVLEKVALWDVIESAGGLDTEFSDELLSHGQRQVFCLARALLRPGNIVVMDEVTSSLDRETDALMQRVIREEFKGKTVLTIAHRVDTVLDYDGIVVLGDGKVVEVGAPSELVTREGGVFRGMVETGN
ncbi:multidrug resistance-like protein [Amniculicola lignicola CBS 123094]|uniref:Multidrug resistance-like protein n=1 Tax=Amniculicola lignicola CBS 123094 TaxID=1392246 RepID=A0A6A5WHU6_9PLEO|nr:multidrug resistance-like protein [Amniculicola lignicola CBS 123094]